MERTFSTLQAVSVTLGILTSCALLAGYVYHLGYTATFGVDASLMGRGFGDLIAESWYMAVRLWVYLWSHWWWALLFWGVGFLGGLVVLIYFVRQRAKGFDLLSQRVTKDNPGRKVLGVREWHWFCLWELASGLGIWVGAAVLILAGTAVVTLLPLREGRNAATAQIEQYFAEGCENTNNVQSPARCIALMDITSPDRSLVSQGILVSANSTHIAIFGDEGLEIWPRLDKYKLERQFVLNVEE